LGGLGLAIVQGVKIEVPVVLGGRSQGAAVLLGEVDHGLAQGGQLGRGRLQAV
jgi:hypothetical protein